MMTKAMLAEIEAQIPLGSQLYFPREDLRGRVKVIDQRPLPSAFLNRWIANRPIYKIRMQKPGEEPRDSLQEWTLGELIDDSMPLSEWLRILQEREQRGRPHLIRG